MSDQIRSLISALHLCRDELAEVYATPQGVFYGPEVQGKHFVKLVAVKAVRKAHDGSYRLDSRLRKFFDWAINRRSLYGNSTHYQDILVNLESAVTGYLESLARANQNELSEKISIVFELCDDFSSGMTEDIEQFRYVLDTQYGFAGDSMEEKIAYNRNRLQRAKELIANVASLSGLDLLEMVDQDDSLARVLHKELYGRYGDIQGRLYEVQRSLTESLFRLSSVNTNAMRLIALDNHLSKHHDIAATTWDDLDTPLDWAMAFQGIQVMGYPDPGSEAYFQELQQMTLAVKDETPVAEVKKRSNAVSADEEPEVKTIPNSHYLESLYKMTDYVLANGKTSALDWLKDHGSDFPYDRTIWLQMLSSNLANGTLDVPEIVVLTPKHVETQDEFILTDFEVAIHG